jgi:hypothetical protein
MFFERLPEERANNRWSRRRMRSSAPRLIANVRRAESRMAVLAEVVSLERLPPLASRAKDAHRARSPKVYAPACNPAQSTVSRAERTALHCRPLRM